MIYIKCRNASYIQGMHDILRGIAARNNGCRIMKISRRALPAAAGIGHTRTQFFIIELIILYFPFHFNKEWAGKFTQPIDFVDFHKMYSVMAVTVQHVFPVLEKDLSNFVVKEEFLKKSISKSGRGVIFWRYPAFCASAKTFRTKRKNRKAGHNSFLQCEKRWICDLWNGCCPVLPQPSPCACRAGGGRKGREGHLTRYVYLLYTEGNRAPGLYQ